MEIEIWIINHPASVDANVLGSQFPRRVDKYDLIDLINMICNRHLRT